MRFDEKTITVNHHDYLLSGYDYSDYYQVDIIPDYYMFEDGMACIAGALCYDMGDTIDVHYLVSITPKGKNKSKVVLDERETIDKEDFDYANDSVFVMICEWIDNRYGKELFELKKVTKRSLKESHKYNNSISLYDNLYNCSPKEMPSDDFLADLLDFAETYDRDYNKKIDELIDMNCGEWFDYVIKYSPKAK